MLAHHADRLTMQDAQGAVIEQGQIQFRRAQEPREWLSKGSPVGDLDIQNGFFFFLYDHKSHIGFTRLCCVIL